MLLMKLVDQYSSRDHLLILKKIYFQFELVAKNDEF